MAGIRRSKGTAPANRKDAATADRVRDMSNACSSDLLGIRDRALILLGFASALRRSELIALTVEDTEWTPRGLLLTIRSSKTDQEGQGRQIAILPGRSPETCPLRALLIWLEAGGIAEGCLLRRVDRHGNVGESLGDRAVGEIVKRLAKRAGLDPARFGGHSLRAGFITSAVDRGARVDRVMDQTGHRTAAMIRTYTRRTDAFEDHAGAGLL
ncbi:MAG: site-specific integrase [bacterium]|nr:site-specific integrase [bacterium]